MKKQIFTFVLSVSCIHAAGQAVGQEKDALASARVHFKERCASAGERITKTVGDVDGVLLLKLRFERLNLSDQFILDDPYGSDYLGEGYIKSFLQAHHALPGHINRVEGRTALPQKNVGYRFVDAVDPADGERYRYTAFIEQPGLADPAFSLRHFRVVLERTPAPALPPRYGVRHDDISTTEDRRHWIAGSSLKVIDLRTGEVIAERIGYMFDPGLGNDSGGRSPWLMAAAHACPAFGGRHPAQSQGGQTVRFVEKVLLPRRTPQHGR